MSKQAAHNQYENPFASTSAAVSDSFLASSSAATIEPDLDLSGQSTRVAVTPVAPAVSGNIGSSIRGQSPGISGGSPATQGGFTSQQTYNGEDTLDEPVSVTIRRDLKQIGAKLQQVLRPKGNRDILKDWDLWGPLFLCLSLAITLSLRAPDDQSVLVFTGIFVIVWCGAAVVTLNAKLLGGAVSFFQSVCVLGYCLFPLVIVAFVGIFLKRIWIRFPLVGVAFVWACYASVGFFSGVHLTNRAALAVYPLGLFYFTIAWMVLIS